LEDIIKEDLSCFETEQVSSNAPQIENRIER
jgi:hypothetical protein